MKHIKFKIPQGCYNPGEMIQVSDAYADRLVAAGVAEVVKLKLEPVEGPKAAKTGSKSEDF